MNMCRNRKKTISVLHGVNVEYALNLCATFVRNLSQTASVPSVILIVIMHLPYINFLQNICKTNKARQV